jgi:hypothetical protein
MIKEPRVTTESKLVQQREYFKRDKYMEMEDINRTPTQDTSVIGK